MFRKSITGGIILLFLLSSLIPMVSSNESNEDNVIYVDDDNTEGPWDGSQEHPYQFIQDAIDAAADDDTVFVYSGTYFENVIVDKTIDLIGEDRDTTIVDGGDSGNVVNVSSDKVIISGFKIQNTGANLSAVGIEIRSNYCTFSGNIISKNGWGVYVYHSWNNTITYNIFSENKYGIYSNNGYKNNISSNTFSSNFLYGIYLGSLSNNNLISDNIISNNDNYGIRIKSSEINTVSRNLFINNQRGLYFCCGARHNKIYHNTFQQNSEWNAYDNLDNQWDDGTHGNYWDDYNGTDADGDGIGDSPYNISSGDSQDRYPLMEPYTRIEVEIKGGFGLKIIIKNVGDAVFTNLTVQISIDGSIILGGQSSGEIMFLEPFNPGVEATLRLFIFGFGRVTITVSIVEQKWKVEGFLLGPFIFILDNYRGDGEWI